MDLPSSPTKVYVTFETMPCTPGAVEVFKPGTDLCAEYLRFVDGEVKLDGSYYKNAIFENMRIIYRGGLLTLENVTFVNCVFDLPQSNPGTVLLASKVLQSTHVTLTSPKA